MSNQELERSDSNASYSSSEKQWTPWLVPMFVVANIAMFIMIMYVNNCPTSNLGYGDKCVATFLGRFSLQPFKENPLLGPSSNTLLKLGALKWDKIVRQHQLWRLMSLKIGIIYLVTGVGGSVMSSLFIQNNISLGASGALFGLLGAMLSELLVNWTIYSNKAASLFTLIGIVLINLAVGVLPHVDNFSHIGGFLTGSLLGFVLLIRPQFKWAERHDLPPCTRHLYHGAGYAIQGGQWTQALQLVPLPKLCANFKMGLCKLAILD
ncbi:RHOMBOID-like protein 2, partial [Cucurbita argyrosperma subsp. argyrosperma]